jgi:hypothetical protein
MRVAISDSWIFSDLSSLEMTQPFFALELEVHTCHEVLDDLFPYCREELAHFTASGQLIVHGLSEQDHRAIYALNYPKNFSFNEKFILYTASQLEALVLSSDKIIRKYAGCPDHGLFWIFDRLVDKGLLEKARACSKLKSFIESHLLYKNNTELCNEKNARLKRWN